MGIRNKTTSAIPIVAVTMNAQQATSAVAGFVKGTKRVIINLPRAVGMSLEESLGNTLPGRAISDVYRQRASKSKKIIETRKELSKRLKSFKKHGPTISEDPEVARYQATLHTPKWKEGVIKSTKLNNKLHIAKMTRQESQKIARRDFGLAVIGLGGTYTLHKKEV